MGDNRLVDLIGMTEQEERRRVEDEALARSILTQLARLRLYCAEKFKQFKLSDSTQKLAALYEDAVASDESFPHPAGVEEAGDEVLNRKERPAHRRTRVVPASLFRSRCSEHGRADT